MRAVPAAGVLIATIALIGALAASAKPRSAADNAYYGVYRAVVEDAADADGLYRVKVKFPTLGGAASAWAPRSFAEPPASGERIFLPRVGSEVLVAFEQGDVRRPVVLGMLWNPSDKPPETAKPQ